MDRESKSKIFKIQLLGKKIGEFLYNQNLFYFIFFRTCDFFIHTLQKQSFIHNMNCILDKVISALNCS